MIGLLVGSAFLWAGKDIPEHSVWVEVVQPRLILTRQNLLSCSYWDRRESQQKLIGIRTTRVTVWDGYRAVGTKIP